MGAVLCCHVVLGRDDLSSRPNDRWRARADIGGLAERMSLLSGAGSDKRIVGSSTQPISKGFRMWSAGKRFCPNRIALVKALRLKPSGNGPRGFPSDEVKVWVYRTSR